MFRFCFACGHFAISSQASSVAYGRCRPLFSTINHHLDSTLPSESIATNMASFEAHNFGKNAVFGKNFKSSWDNIIKSVVDDDSKLYLVADFDHTLTTFGSKQCHDIIAMHDEYPKEFHKEYDDVCKMTFDADQFHTWWRIAHDLIVDRSGLTEEMFQRGVNSAGIQLRSGTADLLAFCRDSKIPTIITSAGITNVITAVLDAHGVPSVHDEHFHIDANHMEFHSDDGTLLRILPEIPVHSKAKKHVHKRAPHMFSSVNKNFILAESSNTIKALIDKSDVSENLEMDDSKSYSSENNLANSEVCSASSSGTRPSSTAAIVLGDNPGDFEVLRELSDINEAVVFRIGFSLDTKSAEKLLDLNCCDVILVGDDHGAEVVLHLIKNLVQSRTISRETSDDKERPICS